VKPDEHDDIDEYGSPERSSERGLSRLVPKQLLGKQAAGPPADQAKKQHGLRRRTPTPRDSGRFV
jgi:hypothetical protein